MTSTFARQHSTAASEKPCCENLVRNSMRCRYMYFLGLTSKIQH